VDNSKINYATSAILLIIGTIIGLLFLGIGLYFFFYYNSGTILAITFIYLLILTIIADRILKNSIGWIRVGGTGIGAIAIYNYSTSQNKIAWFTILLISCILVFFGNPIQGYLKRRFSNEK
jgi:hypothetical protein